MDKKRKQHNASFFADNHLLRRIDAERIRRNLPTRAATIRQIVHEALVKIESEWSAK